MFAQLAFLMAILTSGCAGSTEHGGAAMGSVTRSWSLQERKCAVSTVATCEDWSTYEISTLNADPVTADLGPSWACHTRRQPETYGESVDLWCYHRGSMDYALMTVECSDVDVTQRMMLTNADTDEYYDLEVSCIVTR